MLKLGHNENLQQKNLEKASERDRRANEKERKRKKQLERERVLAEEAAAKKLKLNEEGQQVSDVCFVEEPPKCVDSSVQTEEFDYLVASDPSHTQRTLSEDEFRKYDDKEVKCYTGLPSFDILNIVFHCILPFVTHYFDLLIFSLDALDFDSLAYFTERNTKIQFQHDSSSTNLIGGLG
ncbi:hypothetical protein AWC38_SpisGene10023 [Stylophora pistillata]|uniref:Uncharacterized protein n=1 Tax=Stylophora pistillata TaxID=50429 RepID=A0A2B4S9S4_STYPI|nr:hypothetical protein AWC38_SpisGene10023 [Stylophora pistillata]